MSTQPTSTNREGLRIVNRDGELIYKLRCPECCGDGDIDEDQANGRVSVICGHDCGYHETTNWLADFHDYTKWEPVLRAVREGHCTLGGAARLLGCSDLEIEERLAL